MPGKHVLALTNSNKFADLVVAAALRDFTTVATELRLVQDGWCTAVLVDEDEWLAWLDR